MSVSLESLAEEETEIVLQNLVSDLHRQHFTIMHLAYTFIQSDLHCIQGLHLISSCIL